MGWFKRIQGGIKTSTNDKKEIPEGLWYKCPKCKHIVPTEEHVLGLLVCQKCGFHDVSREAQIRAKSGSKLSLSWPKKRSMI